jgi:hypothetical protein
MAGVDSLIHSFDLLAPMLKIKPCISTNGADPSFFLLAAECAVIMNAVKKICFYII